MQKVVTLGPEGTYSLMMAKYLMPHADIELRASLEEIFLSLEKESYAVVPIRNTISGVVQEVLSHLRSERYQIIDVIDLPLSHVLVGPKQKKKDPILYANPHAYHQCQYTLKKKFPNLKVIFTKSNGETAKILQSDKNAFGIVSETAANTMDLFIVSNNISDREENVTRFLLLQRK